MEKKFSLLYPEVFDEAQKVTCNFTAYDDLHFNALMRFFRNKNVYDDPRDKLIELMTADIDVIKYRNDIIEDLLSCGDLLALLTEMLPYLIEIERGIVSRESGDLDIASRLSMLGEMELFFECIIKLNDVINAPSAAIKSTGLLKYKSLIGEFIADQNIMKLKSEIEKLQNSFHAPRSLTIGVNLNSQLKAVEAGLISINDDYYVSSSFADKLLKMDFAKTSYSCLAEFVPLDYKTGSTQNTALNSALLNTYDKVFHVSMRDMNHCIKEYLKNCSHLLFNIKEVIFYINCCSLIGAMRTKFLPMCKPEPVAASERVTELTRIYNIGLALSIDKIVCNNIKFNDEHRIFIVTGPNGGGKTVFAKAIGLAQILFQLGIYIPAETARMSPVDHIATHFNTAENFEQNVGKFEEECQRVKSMLESTTENSLIIFNEAFNSTSNRDACIISENVLKTLLVRGVRALFVTHLHELSQNIDEMNRIEGVAQKSKAASLVALVDENDSSIKKFRLVIKQSDGRSYADDIAKKYGLEFKI